MKNRLERKVKAEVESRTARKVMAELLNLWDHAVGTLEAKDAGGYELAQELQTTWDRMMPDDIDLLGYTPKQRVQATRAAARMLLLGDTERRIETMQDRVDNEVEQGRHV